MQEVMRQSPIDLKKWLLITFEGEPSMITVGF